MNLLILFVLLTDLIVLSFRLLIVYRILGKNKEGHSGTCKQSLPREDGSEGFPKDRR